MIMKSEPVGIYLEASSLYEATAAVEYYIQQLNKQGIRPIIEDIGGYYLDRATYKNAILSGLIPARAGRKQQEEFLQQPRDFELKKKFKMEQGGLLGIFKSVFSYQAYATNTCASCGGALVWKSIGCELPEEKICQNCGRTARVLDRKPWIQGHAYGDEEAGKSGTEKCKVKQVCRLCGHEKALYYQHTFCNENGGAVGWEYIKEGSCEQNRKCIVCGVIESRTEHAGEWMHIPEQNYVSDGVVVYTEKRTCIRCGIIETRTGTFLTDN